MKTLCIAVISIILASHCVSAERKLDFNKLPPEKRVEIFMRHEGGKIVKPNSRKGTIVYANAQKRAPRAWMESQIAEFNKRLHYAIEIRDAEFTLPKPKTLGEATLFIVDDDKLPSSLLASEDRWALVNVAPLAQGEGVKPQFFEARVKKALTRSLAQLSGAQDSSHPNSLLCCMTTPSDLDTHIDCSLPVDIISRFPKYLERYGIKPEKIVSYRTACNEGWAPPPTNDLQKAVWDKIHAIPTKPLKIEFDPKTDTK